ncbi:MAG: DedA family protein [Candidatus Brocadiia bacterium]|jgi:membrane protein DedA with SNARE-associated domain|nr:DedA family protein [Candidatus Brocadiia bacterium]
MSGAFQEFCEWLAGTVLAIGYPGIVLLMAIESSVIPFPSELVMPPAGYHIAEGNMSWVGVIASGVAGSLIGAYVNYFLAAYLGRPFFLKYGRYFLIKPTQIDRCERFFAHHGEITMFVGRLIPMVRQLISVPAGVARMNLLRFTIYTALGAGIWVTVLTYIGFVVGKNRFQRYLNDAAMYTLAGVFVLIIVYIYLHRRRSGRTSSTGEQP